MHSGLDAGEDYSEAEPVCQWNYIRSNYAIKGNTKFHESFAIIDRQNLDLLDEIDYNEFDERVIPFFKLLAARDEQKAVDVVADYPELEGVLQKMIDFSNSKEGIELYSNELLRKQNEEFLQRELDKAKEEAKEAREQTRSKQLKAC